MSGKSVLRVFFAVAVIGVFALMVGCSGSPKPSDGGSGGTGGASSTASAGDLDGDAILNESDNCVAAYNPNQEDFDKDGIGSACDGDETRPPDPNDPDGDDIANETDNCPNAYNPEQEDVDGDGVGNACDTKPVTPIAELDSDKDPNDTDGDGYLDVNDNCPVTFNQDQLDSDADGIGNVCDEVPMPSSVTYTTSDVFSVDYFYGFYTWYGNTSGLTTAEFLKRAGVDDDELYAMHTNGQNLAEQMTTLAYQQPLLQQPARLISSSYYKSKIVFVTGQGGKFLYYTDYSGLKRVNLAENITQNVALTAGTTAGLLDEGFGTSLGSADAGDLIFLTDDLKALGLKAGAVLMTIPGVNAIKSVGIVETDAGPVSYVKNVLLGFVSPTGLSQSGSKLYVLANNELYKVDASGATPSVETIVKNLTSSKSILVLNRGNAGLDDSSGLVDGDNVIVTFADRIQVYDSTGVVIGNYAFANAGKINKPVFIQAEKALLIPHGNKIPKLMFPLTSNSLKAIAGGSIGATGEFNKNWVSLNTPEYARCADECASVALDPESKDIYAVSGSDYVVRRIVHSADPNTQVKMENYDKSEPIVGISLLVDGKADLQQNKISIAGDVRGSTPGGILFLPKNETISHDRLYLPSGKLKSRIVNLKEDLQFESIEPFQVVYGRDEYGDKNISKIVLDSQGNAFMMAGSKRIYKYENAKEKIFYGTTTVDESVLFMYCDSCQFTSMATLGDYLYVTDFTKHVIYRKKIVDTVGNYEVFAGKLGLAGGMDLGREYDRGDVTFSRPTKIVAVGGKLYFDMSDQIVEAYQVDGGDFKFKIIAGCGKANYFDGTGSGACFSSNVAGGMAALSNNELLYLETSAGAIRRINLTTHEVDTIAGRPGVRAFVDGVTPNNSFARPFKIECVPDRDVCFVVENEGQSEIRVMRREIVTTPVQ